MCEAYLSGTYLPLDTYILWWSPPLCTLGGVNIAKSVGFLMITAVETCCLHLWDKILNHVCTTLSLNGVCRMQHPGRFSRVDRKQGMRMYVYTHRQDFIRRRSPWYSFLWCTLSKWKLCDGKCSIKSNPLFPPPRYPAAPSWFILSKSHCAMVHVTLDQL